MDQNENRQVIAMRNIGVPEENIFIDKKSGKNFDRPHYKLMTSCLKASDLLYTASFDRLDINYEKI